MLCDPMVLRQKINLFFKLVYVNKFNLENCTNAKLSLNSFSLLRLISSEKSKYVVKNISYNNLVVLDWMNMIVVKLGLHKERHKNVSSVTFDLSCIALCCICFNSSQFSLFSKSSRKKKVGNSSDI
jgi:hypothetical protein